MSGADQPPAHGGNGGLCFEDHTCPACETEQPCVDLFDHPICGTVACTADEPKRPTRGLVVHIDPPDPLRNVHPCHIGVHQWAWAHLASGGTAQRCRVCGASR